MLASTAQPKASVKTSAPNWNLAQNFKIASPENVSQFLLKTQFALNFSNAAIQDQHRKPAQPKFGLESQILWFAESI